MSEILNLLRLKDQKNPSKALFCSLIEFINIGRKPLKYIYSSNNVLIVNTVYNDHYLQLIIGINLIFQGKKAPDQFETKNE